MVRKFGIQETSRAIGRSLAGGVAHDEEKIGGFRIFENGLEAQDFSIHCKFGDAGGGHVCGGAEHGWNVEHFWWIVGNPVRMHAIICVRVIPAQSVETGAGSSWQVLDAQCVAVVAMDDN